MLSRGILWGFGSGHLVFQTLYCSREHAKKYYARTEVKGKLPVESFWNQKKIFINYDMRDTFFAPARSIQVDRWLTPGTEFSWDGAELKVIGTPGHTQGSLSFLLSEGGKRLLFCGDLVASHGKIPTMYDLEWQYVGRRGIAAEMASLQKVETLTPDIILPSHGKPSSNPSQWIQVLQ